MLLEIILFGGRSKNTTTIASNLEVDEADKTTQEVEGRSPSEAEIWGV